MVLGCLSVPVLRSVTFRYISTSAHLLGSVDVEVDVEVVVAVLVLVV